MGAGGSNTTPSNGDTSRQRIPAGNFQTEPHLRHQHHRGMPDVYNCVPHHMRHGNNEGDFGIT